MTKQELTKRWKTDEGKVKLKQAIECLTKGKTLSSIEGLEKYAGRWDLRGAQLSTLENEKRIESGGHGVTQKFGTLKLKSVRVESIDFSYTDLSYSWWERCNVNNCLFEHTKARELWVYATEFLNCVFKKTNLSYSYLSENIGSDAGSFRNVEFIESDLTEVIFTFPIIEGCKFIDCNLYATNFDGSRMRNCKFKGRVENPWFRKYSSSARKSVFGLLYRVNPQDYPNLMENIDFSEAELIGVSFSQGIDLTNCIFPNDDSKYIMVRNLREVYSQAKLVVNSEWDGEDKRKGIGFIDTIFYKPDRQNQPMDIIDKNLLVDGGKDKEFGEKFFNLLREINKKYSGNV
jgi:uncharacterized protein YjbI with pentapeptide repeats